MNALPSALLLVTDRKLVANSTAASLVDAVKEAVEAGLRWIWLRDRDLPNDERRRLALEIREATRGVAALSVGGDVELAAEIGTEGVHLPASADLVAARARLGPLALIGVSAHRLEEVVTAREAGADYVTLSPIFLTASKPGYGPALGLEALRAGRALGIPIVALGGVTPENAGDCLQAGASGVAVMGGILMASQRSAAVECYLRGCSA